MLLELEFKRLCSTVAATGLREILNQDMSSRYLLYLFKSSEAYNTVN